MTSTSFVRVKICCISTPPEAKIAVAAGASALGLVSAMPSGPGVIADAAIAEIAFAAPPGVATFLLTCQSDPEAVVRQVRAAGVNTVQLVDAVDDAVYERLRRDLPNVRIVQVVHVMGGEAVADAVAAADRADAVLLDSGNTKLPVKELGGTGRTHDWSISRRVRDRIAKPLYLAGGIDADNVAAALREVEPFGLDVCSGVRNGGKLDASKLTRFFAEVRAWRK